MSALSFDLAREPWLPCRTRDGTLVELGLRELLVQAHELADLAARSPLTYGALLRLLLALLHDVHRGPPNNATRAQWWAAGRWDSGLVEAYFDQRPDRFDLFGVERPFYQDPGFELPVADTIARLAPELVSGNNVVLFDHTLDLDPPALSPAEAARWLVTHQLYGLGGGKGPTSTKHGSHHYASHAPAATGTSLFLRGRSLFETLLLNLVPSPEELDAPIWERPCPAPGKRPHDGPLDYLTWPNRCVRLVPELVDGRVVVRRVHTAQGSTFQPHLGFRDPYFAMHWTGERNAPHRVSAGRALWRDSAVLLGFASSDEAREAGALRPRPTVLVEADKLLSKLPDPRPTFPLIAVGMDFNQSKIELWRAEELPVPVELLREESGTALLATLQAAVKEAEDVRNALGYALRSLAERLQKPASDRIGSKDKPDRGQVADLVESWQAEPRYWAALDRAFPALLSGLTAGEAPAYDNWRAACEAAADVAFAHAEAAAGGSARALRARIRGRQTVSQHWQFFRDLKKGGDR